MTKLHTLAGSIVAAESVSCTMRLGGTRNQESREGIHTAGTSGQAPAEAETAAKEAAELLPGRHHTMLHSVMCFRLGIRSFLGVGKVEVFPEKQYCNWLFFHLLLGLDQHKPF